MELQTYKNGKTIVDAYCEQQSKFKELQAKADVCIKVNNEIEKTISEAQAILREVFKNFHSERVPLGLYLRNDRYGNQKKLPLWIDDKKNLKDDMKYNFSELCLNTIGLTLLPSYGSKSYNILDAHDINESTTQLLYLKEKIPQKKLKETLKPEKFELLNKILDKIENLQYESEFTIEQPLHIIQIGRDSRDNKKEHNTKFMKFEASGYLQVRCIVKKELTYEDISFNISDKDLDNWSIMEQVYEELNNGIEKYTELLKEKKKVITEYSKDLKGRFIKELILMNLKPQKPQE